MAWADDGRSILALIEKSGLQFPDLELARVTLDTGGATRIFSLAPEVLRRGAMIRGVAIDFDIEEDLCFFSVDLEGRDADVCWSVPQEQLAFKRFHPLDQTLRVGGLAIAPDGHSLAMRFGTPGGLSPPAVFDLATERTTLIVPDEAARRAWLELLVRTSRSLLAAALPLAIAEGQARRPAHVVAPARRGPARPPSARPARQAGPLRVGHVRDPPWAGDRRVPSPTARP